MAVLFRVNIYRMHTNKIVKTVLVDGSVEVKIQHVFVNSQNRALFLHQWHLFRCNRR